MKLPNLPLNPVIKRFIKYVVCAALAAGLAAAAKALVGFNLTPAEQVVLGGLIIAAEKAIPQNF